MLQGKHLAFTLLLFGFAGATAQVDSCRRDNRLEDGGARCLALLHQKALNTSAFSTLCLPEVTSVLGCGTDRRFPNESYSLSMMTFGTPPAVDPLSGVDRYLSVIYTSLPGSYRGCDHVYESKDRIQFELDPLSNSSVQTWVIRQIPSFSWRADRTELFTLLQFGVERNFLHMAYANIKGNDVTNASVLREYSGSLNRWDGRLVYVFLLYKQSELLLSSPLPNIVNLTSFVEKHHLQGPVSINWMITEADPLSIQNARTRLGQQNCASLVQKELEKNSPDLPFLTQPYNLTVHLRVRFTSDEFSYKCGPLSITHPASDFFLDPIGNPILNTAELRRQSRRTFVMEMNKLSPNNEIDFAGKLYTLMVVDGSAPWLHAFIINIHGDEVYSGTVIVPYREPAPSSVHTYYFLLYEQKSDISRAATAGFTQTSCPYTRCLDGLVQAFISVNELQLVGATWMRADNDHYLQCRRK